MNTISKMITWLNKWETNKEHNIEVGFDNHAMLKGYIADDKFSCLDEFPDKEFFLKLSKSIPKLYAENKVEYGEIICFIENMKYRISYHYN
ncbi:MAG: hypothetical protein ACOX6N_05135, partial [Patescibacteria group bacterium]